MAARQKATTRTTKLSSILSKPKSEAVKKKKAYVPNISPTESVEQRQLIKWRDRWVSTYPLLYLLHSVPNGGFRSKRTAITMKLEGVVRGIPDLCLPVSKTPYHGLYIELKRTIGGRLSEEQRYIIKLLQEQGYLVVVCKGFEEARNIIVQYLSLGKEVLD